MGGKTKKPSFRRIVQESFDKIIANFEGAPPSEALLNQKLDARLQLMRDQHQLNQVSSEFEKSKGFLVHQKAQNLFKKISTVPPEHKTLIAAAIIYYTRIDDGIDDNDYFFGLDDDTEVLHQVDQIVTSKGR
jgi:hypothetical protein